MRLDIDQVNEKILVQDVPLRLNTVMQGIMGARHVRNTDDWTVPLSWSSLWQVLNDLGKVGEIMSSDELRAWAGWKYEQVEQIYGLQIAQDWNGNARMLPLQRVGTTFLLTGMRCILGDDMGAGKTVMTCDALNSIGARTILIACPKSLMGVWRDHVHEWTTDVTPIVAGDSSAKRKQAIKQAVELVGKGRRVAVIMNYESVWRHTKLSPYGNLRMEKCAKCDLHAVEPVSESKCETHAKELNELDWEVVICDEAHRVINISKQTRGIWHLSKNARYVWALTGTPTRGSVSDFWSLLRLVDPDSWPSRSKFIDRYCIASTDNWGNLNVSGVRPDRREEFEQVTSQYMLRRMFEQIMKGWAEAKGEVYEQTTIVKEERRVELTKAQRAIYTELVDSIFVTLPDGKTVFSDNALEELTRLLQVSSAMITVDDDGKVRMELPSPKVAELLEVVKDVGTEPLVVYAVNRDLLELAKKKLEEAGISVSIVHGGVDQEQREIEVQRFQDGDSRVFLGTFAAASEGLTLTTSHITVFIQRSWSMILNKQAEGRTHRFGQASKTVLYIDIIADDTVESRVHEAYGDKLDALETIVNDAERMRKLL